jgi:hypothetical protein
VPAGATGGLLLLLVLLLSALYPAVVQMVVFSDTEVCTWFSLLSFKLPVRLRFAHWAIDQVKCCVGVSCFLLQVVAFDLPRDVTSYIQCRGRGRKAGSRYCFMQQEEHRASIHGLIR